METVLRVAILTCSSSVNFISIFSRASNKQDCSYIITEKARNSVSIVKASVAVFNQEKALVGAFSVITNLRMELFEALVDKQNNETGVYCS